MAHLYKVKGFLPSQEEIDMLNKIAADSNVLVFFSFSYILNII